MLRLRAAVMALLIMTPSQAFSADPEKALSKIIAAYNLRPLPTKPFERTDKYLLGQALFFDPILSGNRDVACATCHLVRRGTSDAQPVSIGVNGVGLGENRQLKHGDVEHPRNSLDLWNRDNDSVTHLFWDGRVEATGYEEAQFRTPLGSSLPKGLQNTLAAQALFPLTRADEMLGHPGDRSSDELPSGNANLLNELASATAELAEPERSLTIYDLILERLLGSDFDPPSPTQTEYRRLFAAAFPERSYRQFSISDVANSIAHFEEIAFATRDAAWDRYLNGQKDAISHSAKRGAFIFFGRGKCAICHSGPLFSDFEFHSLLVQDSEPGIDGSGVDLGRFYATGNLDDRYKFRTPPLRNVTVTPPYFHNGSVETLEEAIRHHLDPLAKAGHYKDSGAFALSIGQINSVSPVLANGTYLTDEEVSWLMAFLLTLEDTQSDLLPSIIPESVPSGLPISSISGPKN